MRLRNLLRPGWLALTLVVFAFAASCFTLLAPWQFDRHAGRSDRNSALQESLAAEPRPLAEVLPGGSAPSQRTEWDQVVTTGTYLPDDEVVARLRTVQGEPAFEVLTPLRATDGTVILVNRGYVRPNERTDVPAYAPPPSGQVQLVSRVRMDETDPKHRDAFADDSTGGRLHSYSIDSDVVARATNLDVRPGYFQLVDNQPGVLAPLPLPQLASGPFLSYALQWIAFGVMAILGWLYFTLRELKPGGALTTERESKQRRKSVAQILAEDEQEDQHDSGPPATDNTALANRE